MRLLIKWLSMLCVLYGGLSLRADEVIRIMAANTTSGNGQSYDPGEGNRIFQGLAPDIALVQEMNVGTFANKNTPATYRAWVNANFGNSFSYYVEPSGNIPNGIVSRYPILASGEWDDSTMTDRDYVWARIDIPGDKDLWAVSVHISAGGGASQRNVEAAEIKNFILYGVAQDGKPAIPPKVAITPPIPAADYLVIGGDFNTDIRTEACIKTLAPIVVTGSPWPVDQSNNGNTNSGRNKPYDWVIPDADLNALSVPLVVGGNSFPNGLVFDSRGYTPLAAVAPIRLADSGATGMQHMAVVRDFSIPTNDAPLIASAANTSSTEIVTDPDSAVYEIVRAASVGLTVSATDDAGEAALKYQWRLTSGPGNPVTFSGNGTNAAKNITVNFQAVGNYTFTVTVEDAAGLTASSSVKARVVQSAASLLLSPPSASLAVNATQLFSATSRDQFSQPMTTQPASLTWSTTGGGSLNASGHFTATTAGGPFTVTASSGGFSAMSTLTVTRASAVITLAGLSQTYDGSPKSVTASTQPAGRAVTILYAGSPNPPTLAGSYAVTATVNEVNYQGSTSGTLVIQPDDWDLWKNTYFTTSEQTAGLAADLADPDADGLANLSEYALGTQPRDFTAPISGNLSAGFFTISFTRPASLLGIIYQAEASGDLKTWWAVPVELLTTGPTETLRARTPQVAAPRYLRLRIERQ